MKGKKVGPIDRVANLAALELGHVHGHGHASFRIINGLEITWILEFMYVKNKIFLDWRM